MWYYWTYHATDEEEKRLFWKQSQGTNPTTLTADWIKHFSQLGYLKRLSRKMGILPGKSYLHSTSRGLKRQVKSTVLKSHLIPVPWGQFSTSICVQDVVSCDLPCNLIYLHSTNTFCSSVSKLSSGKLTRICHVSLQELWILPLYCVKL